MSSPCVSFALELLTTVLTVNASVHESKTYTSVFPTVKRSWVVLLAISSKFLRSDQNHQSRPQNSSMSWMTLYQELMLFLHGSHGGGGLQGSLLSSAQTLHGSFFFEQSSHLGVSGSTLHALHVHLGFAVYKENVKLVFFPLFATARWRCCKRGKRRTSNFPIFAATPSCLDCN
jgi:hypothetical protein